MNTGFHAGNGSAHGSRPVRGRTQHLQSLNTWSYYLPVIFVAGGVLYTSGVPLNVIRSFLASMGTFILKSMLSKAWTRGAIISAISPWAIPRITCLAPSHNQFCFLVTNNASKRGTSAGICILISANPASQRISNSLSSSAFISHGTDDGSASSASALAASHRACLEV